jgi:hypothetical protein
MEIIATIVLLGLAGAPIALVGAWLVGRGQSRLGALVSAPGGDSWWRTTMPWPQGVQEDDEVKWNFGDRDAAVVDSSARAATTRQATGEVDPAPTRLRPRVRIR